MIFPFSHWFSLFQHQQPSYEDDYGVSGGYGIGRGVSNGNATYHTTGSPAEAAPSFDFSPTPEQRRHAANQGSGALAGGILESMFHRGAGIGRAFELQRAASQDVLDRAQEDARQRWVAQRAVQSDEEQSAWRRKQEENIDADNRARDEALRAKAEHDAAVEEQKKATADAERERQQRVVDALKRSHDPRDRVIADQLEGLVGSEHFPYGEAVSRPPVDHGDKPEHGRWDVDSQGRQVYFPPGGGAPEYRGFIDPTREKEGSFARVNAEVERRLDDWTAHGLNTRQKMDGLRPEELSAKRADIRAEVEKEMGIGASPADESKDHATTPGGASATAVTTAAQLKAQKQLGRSLSASEVEDIAEIIKRGGTAAQVYQILGLK